MKSKWIQQDNKKYLIVFCTGWGMDVTPFIPVPSRSFDILMCFNYADEDNKPDIFLLSQQYEKVILLGWSMGVYFGQVHFEADKSLFEKTIALNGTLKPIDDSFGIPQDIFRGTLDRMNEQTLLRFYKRMCKPADVLRKYLDYRPSRTIEDQHKELEFIYYQNFYEKIENTFYTHVIISDKDLIVPTANQLRFWEDSNTKMIKTSHFPFYSFRSWDDLIDQP